MRIGGWRCNRTSISVSLCARSQRARAVPARSLLAWRERLIVRVALIYCPISALVLKDRAVSGRAGHEGDHLARGASQILTPGHAISGG